MAKVRFVLRNFHDEATLSTQFDAVAGMTAANTQNKQRSRVWRTTDGSDQYMAGTFADASVDPGVPRTVDSVSFFRHRCQGGTFRFVGYSDDSYMSVARDTGPIEITNPVTDDNDWGIDPYGTGSNDPFLLEAPFKTWFDPAEILSYKYFFSGNVPTYGADYWEVSRFCLGKYFEPLRNPSFGMGLGFEDKTYKNRSMGGSLPTNIGPSWHTLTMDFTWIKQAYAARWRDFMRYEGTGRDFVVSLYPEDETREGRDHHMNVVFSQLNPLIRQFRLFTMKLQMEEV